MTPAGDDKFKPRLSGSEGPHADVGRENPPDDRFSALADAVADGADMDWAGIESNATDADERDLIEQLRILADLVQVNRTFPSEPDAPVQVGLTSWGHLDIRAELGGGSFGTVFRAWDKRLEREVALKILHDVAPIDEDAASVVIHEGRLLAQIRRHPNVVLPPIERGRYPRSGAGLTEARGVSSWFGRSIGQSRFALHAGLQRFVLDFQQQTQRGAVAGGFLESLQHVAFGLRVTSAMEQLRQPEMHLGGIQRIKLQQDPIRQDGCLSFAGAFAGLRQKPVRGGDQRING